MPRIPERAYQEPLALYPVVEQLNEVNGVLQTPASEVPGIIPEKRVTLLRLASLHGLKLGPKDAVTINYDSLLDIAEQDFNMANAISINTGLYIYPGDERYRSPATEQLVRIRKDNEWNSPAVVFPTEQFRTVARSPQDLAKHAMAVTREANKDNSDPIDVEGKVGRSAGHALLGKINGLEKLEATLAATRNDLLLPLNREVNNNTSRPWQAHYLPKNIDKKRKQFDEELHHTLDTAAINLNIGTTALQAAHRALVSNLYRRGSRNELSSQWLNYLTLSRDYVKARRSKIATSKAECKLQMNFYQQFIDQTQAA